MRDLLLVTHYEEGQHEVLPEVCRRLRQLGVRARLVHDAAPQAKHRLWTLGRPTAVVSMRPLKRFTPSWATIWQQLWLDKVQEYMALQRLGISVPRWKALYEDRPTDLDEFGSMVVVKPARGAKGALVRVMRRNRVAWRPLHVKTLGQVSEALIVQEYIHSGPRPTTYRVGTVFGEPIYAWRVQADPSKPPIEYRGSDDTAFTAGVTIVSTGWGSEYLDERPADVLALARQVHRAFPTIPLLGIDMIRDANTGQLHVLEVNASGGTFNLHPKNEVAHKLPLTTQFGGAAAVARGLVGRMMDPTWEHAHA